MPDDVKRTTKGILGDINPNPSAKDHTAYRAVRGDTTLEDGDDEQSMDGGSGHDRSRHSGSRDVTEGTTGGVEVGGTRNFRTGSGATGSDLGNRPE